MHATLQEPSGGKDGSACQPPQVSANEQGPETVALRLSVRCSGTKWGDTLAVAGEGPALRLWGEGEGGPLLLQCVDASGTSTWPVWRLVEPVRVPVGRRLEYKYLILRGEERRPKWETRHVGENRHLMVSGEMVEKDDGEFGHLAMAPTAVSSHAADSAAPYADQRAVESQGVEARERKEHREPKEHREAKEHHETKEHREDKEHREVKEQREREREERRMERRKAEAAADEEESEGLPQHTKLRQLGKGKQGRCYLVELGDAAPAVLKELKGGGRHAFKAELGALQKLRATAAAAAGTVPRLLGASPGKRQVMMSLFEGSCAPDSPLLPALKGSATLLPSIVRSWLDLAMAVHEAHGAGVVHCDVNPWNILLADDPSQALPRACLVDWACALAPQESGRLPLSKRGDFQSEELLKGRVGPRTDVYGSASTLLWLLVRRTRKGLPDRSPASLEAYFEAECAAWDAGERVLLPVLARTCCWGMEENWDERCSDLSLLCQDLVQMLTP